MKHFSNVKNIICVLAVALALLATHGQRASALCGDVNGDGYILSNDVLMVARASIDALTLTTEQKARADVTLSGSPDGYILSNDLLLVARASISAVEDLNCNYADDMDYVAEIFTDAGALLYTNLTTSETNELKSKMSESIAMWQDTYDTHTAKRVAIKDNAMAIFFGETFSESRVSSEMDNLMEGYIEVVPEDAVANTSLVTQDDMEATLKAYDYIRGMLIDVLTEDVGATRAEAFESTEAFLTVLARLGAASEDTSSMDEILDNWVVEWAKDDFEAELMTALAPLDMDDPTKTENLMLLVRDLYDLPSGATEQDIRQVMNQYLTEATTDVAINIMNKAENQTCEASAYYTLGVIPLIDLNLSPDPNCIGKSDIMLLAETHYEKDLPKLEAFIDGLEAWIEDPSNNSYLTAIALAETPFNNIVTGMQAGDSQKAEIGAALDTAGIKKEIFWLYINLEPYMNQ